MGCRVLVAVVLAGVLVGVSPPPAPVSAQGPSLTCDVPFPAGGRALAASNHDCWMSESGGQGAAAWPPAASFAEGSVVTVYSLRWSGDGAVRLYCSAESGRGPDYDRWFVAAAVRGGSTIERASYGIRAASVPGGDRLVSSFFGGRDERVEWDRGSRYDAAAGRWVSRSWEVDRSRAAPPTPAFMRAAPEPSEPAGGARESARRPARPGYTCPDFGLLARRLGGRIDESVGGPGVPARCLDTQGGAGAIFNGDELNVQARYLPALGRFGGDGGGGTRWANQPQGSSPGGEGGGGVPGGQDCGGENNAVCNDPGGGNHGPDGRGPNGNRNTRRPREGQGGVVETPGQSWDGVPGSGRRLADAPVVAALSSGMACVERESVVLRRHRRQRWVDDSHAEYDPGCDLSAAGLPPGQSAAGLRPAYCGSEGFDLGGSRVVQSGYWETWWEHVWEANPARTDDHYPWARVFWQDGGGRPGFESGGVIVGDDGAGACLVEQGFVRNPALPGVVPPVAARLAGRWADYASGTVPVRCPKEDGSAGFTSAPAGAQGAGFDVFVSLDFAPLVHDEARAESYTLAQYESARPCSDWPAGADPAPVPGVDCGVRLPVSAARQRRLDSFGRWIRTSAGTGRITSLFVDDPNGDDGALVGRPARVRVERPFRARYALGRRRRRRVRRRGRGPEVRPSRVVVGGLRPARLPRRRGCGFAVGRVGGAGASAGRGRDGRVARVASAGGGLRRPHRGVVHCRGRLPAGAGCVPCAAPGDRAGGWAVARRSQCESVAGVRDRRSGVAAWSLNRRAWSIWSAVNTGSPRRFTSVCPGGCTSSSTGSPRI